ncbi:MAG TPA: hypothetical protein VF395_19370 [Polyangiaceae bacterium]
MISHFAAATRLAVLALLASLVGGCGTDGAAFRAATNDAGTAAHGGVDPGGSIAQGSGGTGGSGNSGHAGAGGLSGTNQSPDAHAGGGPGALGDGGAPRHFRLATTGAQLVVTGSALGLQLTPANVADDSDVMAVHQEFYGVPWDAFEAETPPPAPWVSVMDGLASATRSAKKPVFLSVSLLNGQRQSLAAKTKIENGEVKTTDGWSASCYDFRTAPDSASKEAAYLRYVTYMVDEFAPAYLNVAIEVNLFFEKCPSAGPGLVAVVNRVYDAVKKRAPKTLVFPSFQIDHLYGYSKDSCADATKRSACFDAAYAVIAPMRRDRFAMSSYPYMDEVGTVSNLPGDWFTRGAARASETPLIAETGWLSTDLVVRAKNGTCPKIFSFDEKESAAYLGRVLGDADSAGLDLVTWWSDRDLVVSDLMTNCPCTFDATWCTVLDIFRGPASLGPTDTQLFGELLLKAFGTMGLRTYDGTPKAGHLALWHAALARPLAP